MAGIVRQNQDATWHDREISIVHIPIIELDGETFDKLVSEMKSHQDVPAVSSILFGE